ncbi:GDSL esterase/lipase At2g04570-like [Juglans regia]|uniref:GDSL esterase/lipase At2g04570-like n=1 Tax=Juglans regia TaxID=51240 RepID=A0A6P9EIX9_JUGRE|nr:GDSL esterase/lipase At2g04570-like [Juglans regia]
MTAAGEPLRDCEVVSYLLNGLNSEYESFVISVTTKATLISSAELFNLNQTRINNFRNHPLFIHQYSCPLSEVRTQCSNLLFRTSETQGKCREIMEYMYSTTILLLLLTIFLVLFDEISAKVPAIIVFGDSSVDAGNNNQIPTIARSNFEPYGRDFKGGKATGRFSNGRITTDFIAEAFGLKPIIPAYLDPSYNIADFATGVTFASAGTGYDNATSSVLSVIPLWKELEYYKDYQKKLRSYLGESEADKRISEALHVMSLGTNDFLENYYSFPGGRQSQFSVTRYEDYLIGIATNFIKALYGLGARKISLGGLPPMGCLPLERATNIMGGNGCNDRYNNVSMEFNEKLKKLTVELNKELSGIKLVFSNPYYVLLHIIKKPSSYGFEVTSVACCATGMFEMGYSCNRDDLFTCTDANKYVFWDAFHPTQKTNSIVSNYVVKKVLAEFL